VIPGVVFSGTTSGVMRAYSTTDGRILWEYDTVHEYTTVNGVPGKGGSINGPGPTIVGGKLFMNSGYVVLGGALPGNVLLAFGVEQ
jgi:polyvinyl alcohol dehydrogenase (cytochrome)